MSGMAILLLCALQVDDSGWRRSTQSQLTTPPPSGNVQPTAANNTWGNADALLERSERALQDGIDSARDYLRPPPATTGPPYSQPNPSAFAAPGTSWPEVEQALGQPVSQPSRAAVEDTLRNRIRGADNLATPVPVPPTNAAAASRYSTGASPSAQSRYSDANATNMPPRGGLQEWLEQDPDGLGSRPSGASPRSPNAPRSAGTPPTRSVSGTPVSTAAGGFPSASDSFGRAPDELRLGQTFPRPPSDTFGHGPINPAQGREVMYEGQPAADASGNQRYITPPGRVSPNEPLANRGSGNPPGGAQDGSALTLPAPPGANDPAVGQGTGNSKTPELTSANRPWGPLLMTVLGLFGSLGFNLYLGWIAWDLYTRYQDAVDDVQELEAKLEAKQQELSSTPGIRTPSSRRATMTSA